jgi:CubicO group peptidase (beta-lactamase class C family)
MKMLIALIVLLLAILMACSSGPQLDPEISGKVPRALDYCSQIEKEARYPGFCYSAFTVDSELIFCRGGYADIAGGVQVDDTSVFYNFSMTKVVTALAVVQLHDRGLLSINEPLSTYLPDLPHDVTIKQVLSHSSGIPNPSWGTHYVHYPEAEEKLDRIELLRQVIDENRKLKFEPGSNVAYSNLGYAILGAVIEDVSGMKYEEYVERHIFAPIGLDRSKIGFRPPQLSDVTESYIHNRFITKFMMKRMLPVSLKADYGKWTTMRENYSFDLPAHGGMLASADELTIFLQAVLLKDPELLSDRGWELIFTPLAEGKESYACGWRVKEKEGKQYFEHAGGAMGISTMMRIYPDEGTATIFLSNVLDSRKDVPTDIDTLDGILVN